MAKTNPVNPNRPLSTGESPRLGDNVIRALAAAVAEILGIDHYIGTDSGSGYTEDAAGEHKRIKFNAPISTPTNVTNKGFLYVKDFSGKLELCFLDEDGDEIQLTSGGVFNPALACGLTGNQTIAGVKTFSSIPVLPASSPSSNNQAARKKYVDDAIDTDVATAVAGAGFLKYSGVTVFNQAIAVANTWEDLDLSAVVGSRRALVFLQVYVGATGGSFYCKPKGYGDTPPNTLHNTNDWTGGGAVALTGTCYSYMTMATDSAGVIQIAASNTSSYVIRVVVYVI
jgi:hypothetical protein